MKTLALLIALGLPAAAAAEPMRVAVIPAPPHRVETITVDVTGVVKPRALPGLCTLHGKVTASEGVERLKRHRVGQEVAIPVECGEPELVLLPAELGPMHRGASTWVAVLEEAKRARISFGYMGEVTNVHVLDGRMLWRVPGAR
jgi:hypothetical protein